MRRERLRRGPEGLASKRRSELAEEQRQGKGGGEADEQAPRGLRDQRSHF